MKTEVSCLDNGLRIVTCRMPSVQSAAVGIWAAVGGRHEPASLCGISHFLEHMLFKGTSRRSSKRIMQEIEGMGGDINASTSEDRTCYYASVPGDGLVRAFDVLADLYRNPKLASRDVELERGVIAEEIQMYHDEPSQRVHELLNEIYWPNHPLGRPITGTVETISHFDPRLLRDYLQANYHGTSTVVSAAGCVDHERIVELARRNLGDLAAGSLPHAVKAPPKARRPRVGSEFRETQQTQIAIGLPFPAALDPRRFAGNLLHVILGGNGSSRLFQEIRERRGYCYSISTYPHMLLDTGILVISVGLDPENVPRCLRLIRRELTRIREEVPGTVELNRAKRYLTGLGRMALERTSSQNSRIAQALLSLGHVPEPEETYAKFECVQPGEITAVARDFLDPRSAVTAVVGPGLSVDPREFFAS
jgi:predicted Zn-dependent peptidase